MKKCGHMFIALVLSALPLLSQETLKYYLDSIADLNRQGIEAQNDYSMLCTNEINQLRTDAQFKISAIQTSEKFAWEDPVEDFLPRITEEIAAVNNQLAVEIASTKDRYKALYLEKNAEIEGKKRAIADQMVTKEFCYSGNSVSLTFGTFETKGKYFPVSVKCLESDLPYSNSELIYDLDKSIIAKIWEPPVDASQNNKISAEIYFQVFKKSSFSDEYQKKITRIVLRGDDNSVLKEYTINEIVETFSILQVVNEESSIINAK